MKFYFDHRMCDAASIYIYVNDEYLGRVRARKERVTIVEIPTHAERVRLSFSAVFDSSDELEKEEIKEIFFGFEDENRKLCGDLKRKDWQYPYDLVIDTKKYSMDIVFYPENLNIGDTKNILFYKACSVEGCDWIEMRLLKRKQDFGIKKYRKEKLIAGGMLFLGACIFLLYHLNHYIVDYIPNRDAYEEFYTPPSFSYGYYGERLIRDIVVGVAATLASFWWTLQSARYVSMYREERLKDVYVFTKEGCIEDVPNVF